MHVDATGIDLHDPHVRVVTVPGTRAREAAMIVERAGSTTLVVNDVIWNVAHRRGLGGWLLKVAGFTGSRPKVPPFVLRKAVEDRSAFAEALARWAALPGLRRIVPSHGEIVVDDAAGVLRDLSTSLAA